MSADAESVAAMCALIGEVLEVADIQADEDFFDLGGTSLKAALLVAQIERRFGAGLTVADLYDLPTAQALAAHLGGPRSPDEQAPVFLVHWYPVDVMREIRRHRPAVVLSYGLDADDRWPPPVGIEALAAHYVTQMRRMRPVGPYHLVGYSLGGIIAWEIARQLGDAETGVLCVIDAHPVEVRWRPLGRWTTIKRITDTPPRVLIGKARSRLLRKVPEWPRVHRMMWARSDQSGRLSLIDHRLGEYRMRPFGGRLLLVAGLAATESGVLYSAPPPLGKAYAELGLAKGPHRLVEVTGDHHGVIAGASARLIADAIEDEMAAL